MAKRALVTGASGFIGSTLIEELSNLGFEVLALMRGSSSAANLEGLRYTRVEGDLSNRDSLRRALQGVDYVFHLAGATAAPNREAYFRHNADGTRILTEAVAEAAPGLTRFVHVSSLAAAGPASSHDAPRVETEPNRPVSAYGESKLQGELEVLKHKDSFPVVIVRPPMVYGPKDKGVYVIIQTVSRNVMPILSGSGPDGQKYYSAVHVRDLVRGIVAAGLAPVGQVPSGEIFYISSDEVHSYREFLSTIARSLQLKPFSFPVPKGAITAAAVGLSAIGKITGRTFPLNMDKLNEILPDYWVCSNRKARELLGFEPQYTLTTGMADAIDWYKRQRWL